MDRCLFDILNLQWIELLLLTQLLLFQFFSLLLLLFLFSCQHFLSLAFTFLGALTSWSIILCIISSIFSTLFIIFKLQSFLLLLLITLTLSKQHSWSFLQLRSGSNLWSFIIITISAQIFHFNLFKESVRLPVDLSSKLFLSLLNTQLMR